MAESKTMAPRLDGSRAAAEAKAKAKAKAKGPTWAEAQAMEKRLDSMNDKISDLSWRLNLEKIRGCFGDKFVETIFPSETSGGISRKSQLALAFMGRCLDLASEFEKRRLLMHSPYRYLSGISGEFHQATVSKRLRKEAKEEELSEEEFQKPRHIKDIEEERRRLSREYLLLYSDSEKRAPDFSGMTEADRAAEAEKLREELFQEASGLLVEQDIIGALRQGSGASGSKSTYGELSATKY